ncbi:hypothetical protein ABKA04_009531 [Annulohypoxylon sp. FPYF3050]
MSDWARLRQFEQTSLRDSPASSSLYRHDRNRVLLEQILEGNAGSSRDQLLSKLSPDSSSLPITQQSDDFVSTQRKLHKVLISEMKNTPITLSSHAPSQDSSLETNKRIKLLDLLWSQPIGLIHDHLLKSKVQGTGEWVFELPTFQNWIKETIEPLGGAEKEGCLWVQGNLGAGKTMLMNTIVNKLKSEVIKELGQESKTVYYYFDRSGGCKPYQAVASCLRQMCDQKDIPLPKFVTEIENNEFSVSCHASHHQYKGGIHLANLISDFLSVQSQFKRVYICLDGLEECDDLFSLISIIYRFSSIGNLRLIITARPRIVQQCIALGVGCKEMIVQLEDHNGPDMERYIESFFQDQLHICLSDMVGKEAFPGLVNMLVEKSGGKLPPLTLITTVCMGFVHIDYEKQRVFTTPSALPFYLYQFSDEFARQAREYASISCLALIYSNTLSQGPCISQSQYNDMERRLPFARYVSQNWGVHLDNARDEESVKKILENDLLLQTLSQILHVSSRITSASSHSHDNYPSGFGSRHFGAYFGLSVAFKNWQTQEDWVVARDSWNRSPFHVCFLSPGLYACHGLFDIFSRKLFSRIISGDFSPDIQGSEEDEDEESEEDEDHAKPFRHKPVKQLPWKWRPSYKDYLKGSEGWVMIENLHRLFTFSEDEISVADKDGKTPLHHFFIEWPEDTLYALMDILFDRRNKMNNIADDTRKAHDNETISNATTISHKKTLLSLENDYSGRTILDYACERHPLFGTLVAGITEWLPKQISNGIAIAASCGYKILVDYMSEFIDETNGQVNPDRPIIEASKRGFIDIVRLLRQKGVDIHIQDDDGMSPLHHAAYGSHTDTVRFLLLEGGDPNQLDKGGRSPLFCGCESGSDAIITLLREKRASITCTNDNGQTLLHLAALKGNVDVARRLLDLDGGAVQYRMPNFQYPGLALQSPLHIAAREGHFAVVQLLVREGFLIDGRDGDGRTPLSYACEGGHLDNIQFLFSKKRFIDVNSMDDNGRTPLSYAAAEGHVDVVAALIGQGSVNPNIKDIDGKTALIHAAQRGHNDTVVVLILLTSDNYTARTAAFRSFKNLYLRFSNNPIGNIAIDTSVKDKEERSAVSYLRQSGNDGKQGSSDVARYIVEISERLESKASSDGSEGKTKGGNVD